MPMMALTSEMRNLTSFPNFDKYFSCKWLCFLLVFLLLTLAKSGTVIETLPGFAGKLPFKLETGYVSVGDLDELQLFYYFIESERNPVRDPLLLWLTGGPGCSGFSGLVYEVGPLIFDYESFNGSLPSLLTNPYSWTKIANIIFVDAPVGTGFSYSESQEGYNSSDTKAAQSMHLFLRKWLWEHPQYMKNPLYITGDSYGGKFIPMVTFHISNDNMAGKRPNLNLQGYSVGNPVTNLHSDENSRVTYIHRMGLISEELYKSAQESCQGEYVYPDPANSTCLDNIGLIAECTMKVCDAQILEPKCSFSSPKPKGMKWGTKFFEDIPDEILKSPTSDVENWCRNNNYVLSYVWANDASVQEALHIRNGTINDWKRCNKSLAYESDVLSVVLYHQELVGRGYRALVYSGDHDMLIPYIATQTWIALLNMTTTDGWRPWFVEGQIAGFTEKYQKVYVGDGLTFATVKGAGHTAPEYKPKECLAMVDRWFSYYAL